MHQYGVYIVRCSDGSYYTGVTNDIAVRVWQHNAGIHPESYTFKRRPVKLVYGTYFQYVLDAIAWEKQIKGWSRKKKEALIQDRHEILPELAQRRTRKAKHQNP